MRVSILFSVFELEESSLQFSGQLESTKKEYADATKKLKSLDKEMEKASKK